jgi:hypothetical protein
MDMAKSPKMSKQSKVSKPGVDINGLRGLEASSVEWLADKFAQASCSR